VTNVRILVLRLACLVSLACVGAIALSACGSSGGSSSSSGGDTTASADSGGGESGGESLNIGLFMTGSTNAYQQNMISSAEKTAKELGAQITVLDSEFEAQTQINQMQLAAQRGSYNAWIVAPSSGELECTQIEAAAEEVPLFLAGANACDGHTENVLGVSLASRPETYEGWWNYILENAEPGPISVILGPPELETTVTAEKTLEAALEKHPGFEPSIQTTDYTTGQAFKVAQDVLQANPDLKTIVSNYAGMTEGVLSAVKQAGDVGKIAIYDQLGNKPAVESVEKGEITMTEPGLPRDETQYAVEALVKNAEGKPFVKEYNPVNSLKFNGAPFVTKENASEFEAQY
jgi:ribose transport system substrate-binding protein